MPRAPALHPGSQAPGAALLVVLCLLTPPLLVGAFVVRPIRAVPGEAVEHGERRVIVALGLTAVLGIAADVSLPLVVLALVVVRDVGAAVVCIARHA